MDYGYLDSLPNKMEEQKNMRKVQSAKNNYAFAGNERAILLQILSSEVLVFGIGLSDTSVKAENHDHDNDEY